MKYFSIDAKRVVHFENTDQLAQDINQIIQVLRARASTQDPKLGDYVKKRTPGPTKVKIGVQMALKNNGFDLKTQQFAYQGKGGIVTNRVNSKLNAKIRGLAPDDLDLAEATLAGFFDRAIAGSQVQGTGPLSAALAHAVVSSAMENEPSQLGQDFEALGKQMQMALDNAKVSAKNLKGTIRVDTDKHLLTFHDTDKLAEGVNGVIKDVRGIAAAVPGAGQTLSQYVTKKTPGPKSVNLAVKQFFRGNAFDYQAMEFKSQGSSLGTTKIVNHFVNKKLKPHKQELANIVEFTQLAIGIYLADQQLKELQGELKELVAGQIALQILALADASEGSEG
jgi:hypothetical protein